MTSSKNPSRSSIGSKPSAASVHIAENLAALKTMMASATDFQKPMVFFMDALVDDPNFMAAGKLSRDKKLKGLFRLISETLYRQVMPQHAQTASHLLITSLEKLSFSHSGGQIGNNILTLIYFHDIDQGMAAMADMRGDGETLFARFSAQQFTPSGDFSFVPGNSQTRH
ncbi:MAG: hypothetical protein ACOYNF_08510 [Rhodoferax sp.]